MKEFWRALFNKSQTTTKIAFPPFHPPSQQYIWHFKKTFFSFLSHCGKRKYSNYFLWIFHSSMSSSPTDPSSRRPLQLAPLSTSIFTDILSLVKDVEWENNLQVITLSNNHKSIYFMMRRERKTEKFIIRLVRSFSDRSRRSDITIF